MAKSKLIVLRPGEKAILFALVLIVAAVVVAVSWDYIKHLFNKVKGAQAKLDNDGDLPKQVSGTSQPATQLDWNRELKRGTSGEEVKLLQQWANLVQSGNAVLVVDGQFGPLTEAKVFALTGRTSISLQQAYDLLKNILTNHA